MLSSRVEDGKFWAEKSGRVEGLLSPEAGD